MERQTRQRQTILKVFRNEGRPLSVLEVLELARRHFPRLGIATVYRAVKDLTGTGELIPVPILDHGVYYELRGADHHHHFFCRACRRVYEVHEPCGLCRDLPQGFLVESHEVTYRGLCPSCRREQGELARVD